MLKFKNAKKKKKPSSSYPARPQAPFQFFFHNKSATSGFNKHTTSHAGRLRAFHFSLTPQHLPCAQRKALACRQKTAFPRPCWWTHARARFVRNLLWKCWVCPPQYFANWLERVCELTETIPSGRPPTQLRPHWFSVICQTQSEGQRGAPQRAIHKVFLQVWHRQVRTWSAILDN